jgi:hypothetical protein
MKQSNPPFVVGDHSPKKKIYRDGNEKYNNFNMLHIFISIENENETVKMTEQLLIESKGSENKVKIRLLFSYF